MSSIVPRSSTREQRAVCSQHGHRRGLVRCEMKSVAFLGWEANVFARHQEPGGVTRARSFELCAGRIRECAAGGGSRGVLLYSSCTMHARCFVTAFI